jgi:hypothetical protein
MLISNAEYGSSYHAVVNFGVMSFGKLRGGLAGTRRGGQRAKKERRKKGDHFWRTQ